MKTAKYFKFDGNFKKITKTINKKTNTHSCFYKK